MKRKMLTLGVLVLLILAIAVPASAASYLDVTIYGTQNYDEANEVLTLVNEQRAAAGLSPVTMDPVLCQYAMQRAAETNLYFSHTRPDRVSAWNTVMDATHGSGARGENIAYGYADAAAVMNGWMNSDGHRANILTAQYQTIGIGCFRQDDGSYYWVQLFSSLPATGTYSRSGVQDVGGIPIRVPLSGLTLNVGVEYCVGYEIYEGMTKPIDVAIQSTYGPVKMDGGFTFEPADPALAQFNQDRTYTGLEPGTCQLTVRFDSGYGFDMDLTVYPMPTLKTAVDNYGQHTITFTDEGSEIYLFGKEADDELWSLLLYPLHGDREFTNFAVFTGDTWTYQLRYWDDRAERYINCGEPVTIGDLAAPTVTGANVSASGKPRLTWEAVPGAAKYEVYRSASQNGSYTKMFTTTATSYTNTNAVAGKTYYYKVRALSASGTASAYSEVVSRTCDLARPVVTLSNVASTGKIKITWKAISGADRYEVYRAASKNGTYTKLGSTTGTKFTNTSAVAGKTYYYKVKAIYDGKSAANSAFSEVKYRCCDLARPVVTLSNVASTGKIKITWKAISGADRYEVYRAASKNGTYTKLGSTTGTKFTNTSAVAGKTYYYKVKAIYDGKSAANSAFSEVKYRCCDLAQPVVTLSNVASTGKIKITWTAISGADRYEVYRAASKNGTYTKLGSTTGTKFTNTSAVAGKTYYYKVRAIDDDKSSAASAYSEIKYRTCDLARPDVSIRLSDKKPAMSWKAIDGAVKYEIYRSTSKDGTYKLIGTTTKTAVRNSDAVAGKTYYYKVRAIASKSAANSAYSLVDSIQSK